MQVVLVVVMAALALPPLAELYRGAGSGMDRLRRAGTGSPGTCEAGLQYFMNRGNGPDPAIYFTISADQAAAVSYYSDPHGTSRQTLRGQRPSRYRLFQRYPFLFPAQRATVTKYHEFNPGLTTTSQTQQAIIEALRAETVPYVVRLRYFDNGSEPNSSVLSSGVLLLDEFLQSEYTEVARFGQYEITQRRQ